MYFNICFVLISANWMFLATSAHLYKCVLGADPHLQRFHSLNSTPPAYTNCINDGTFIVARSSLISVTVDIFDSWITDITFVFRNRTSAPAFCTISSYNFLLAISSDCTIGNVVTKISDYGFWTTLSVKYEIANFTAVVTHLKNWPISHFNLGLWMPKEIALNTTGLCTTSSCGSVGKRSVRSLRDRIINKTNISNSTAAQICNAFIQPFLNRINRPTWQRNIHYTGTLNSVLNMCIFDVMRTNAAAAVGALQLLMIEEATTEVFNLNQIQSTFENRHRRINHQGIQSVDDGMITSAQLLNVNPTPMTTNELYKCIVATDPHIQTFHSINQSPPPYIDCSDEGSSFLLKADLIQITADGQNNGAVDFNYILRKTPTQLLCTITARRMILNVPQSCSAGNVSVLLTNNTHYVTFSMFYPVANVSVIVTQQVGWQNLHYNMVIWMPRVDAQSVQGICSTRSCTGRGTNIVRRSVDAKKRRIREDTQMTRYTAGQLCDKYIENYLRKLTRLPSQRDVHYNGTIENVREMCIYDVLTTGPAAAPAILDILMLEDTTSGISNPSEIHTVFEERRPVAVAKLLESIREIQQQIADQ